jgi:nucleoside-diphosphate-sugar epimerase
METVSEIIATMRAVAAPGRRRLDSGTRRRLAGLTRSLIAVREEAQGEYARFLAIGERRLCLPEAALKARLSGAVVMVTGGTGCIGSAVMAQVAARCPGRLVSVSRGMAVGWPRVDTASYLHADIRDRDALSRLFRKVRPDLVFHVAAQRDPGLAEVEVHRTVSTNVFGTRNVLTAAAEAGVPQVVCASTGKALRSYSPDIYTASKRVAEWVTATVAENTSMLCSAGRFTHILDNSIIYRRLLDWVAADSGDVIRLHSPDIGFYVQSALESAGLLLLASLGGRPGESRIYAISDLGWPVNLLDVALAVVAHSGRTTPIYFSGYDQGYEEIAFPGLYDPATAGDVSPLLNAFEAGAVAEPPCPMVDGFRVEIACDQGAAKRLSALAELCERTADSGAVRGLLNELSWSLLEATLRAVPRPRLARAAAIAERRGGDLGGDHARVLQAIRDACCGRFVTEDLK